MPLPAARIGDMHVCPMVNPGPVPHVGGPIVLGCFTVIVGGMPAARVGDICVCVGPPDVIAMGATHVLIGGSLAARITDPTVHGGKIVMGCPTVLIEPGENKQDSDDDQSQDGDQPASSEDAKSDEAVPPGGMDEDGGMMTDQPMGSLDDTMQTDTLGGLDTPMGEPVDADVQVGQEGLDINSTGIEQTGASSYSIGLEATPTGMAPVPSLGDQIVGGFGSGFGDAFSNLASSVGDTARGAFNLATSQDARNQAGQQIANLGAGIARAAQDPIGTTQLAGQAVQNSWNGYQDARNEAYRNGVGPQFDAKAGGRLFGEVLINAAPALGGARNIGKLGEATKLASLAAAADKAGISESTAVKLAAIAEKNNVLLDMRPTNPAARKLIEAGHSPKPELLKMKTINNVDRQLGATGGDGELGFFKPTKPDTTGLPRDQAKALNDRFKQRNQEWNKMQGKVQKLESDGKIKVEDGVVKDMRDPNSSGYGKSFTGDNDIYGIRGADGRKLTGAEKATVVDELKRSGVGVEHGALKDWKTTNLGDYMAKNKMLWDHSPDRLGGGQGLVTFGPGGPSYGFPK